MLMATKKEKEKIETTVEKELTGKELEKAAEAESVEVKETSIEDKKKALLERAAALKAEKTESLDTEALKEEVKASKKKGDMLVDLEEYVKTGIS